MNIPQMKDIYISVGFGIQSINNAKCLPGNVFSISLVIRRFCSFFIFKNISYLK